MKRLSYMAAMALLIIPLSSCEKSPGLSMAVNPPDVEWLFMEVYNRDNEKVLEVTVTDMRGEKNTMEAPDNIGGYAAKIFENSSLWIFIKDRFRIHIDAEPAIKAKDYKNTSKLKEFALLLNLAGLASVDAKEKLRSQDLLKYMPKLAIIKKKR